MDFVGHLERKLNAKKNAPKHLPTQAIVGPTWFATHSIPLPTNVNNLYLEDVRGMTTTLKVKKSVRRSVSNLV